MQTTTEQRIAAEIKLLQFVIDNMPIKGVKTAKVFMGDNNSYQVVMWDYNNDCTLYDLGNDINNTIQALETIKQEWS